MWGWPTWGFLSNAAVLAVVLRALTREVLPESTWPRTPTLKLNMALFFKITIVSKVKQFANCKMGCGSRETYYPQFPTHKCVRNDCNSDSLRIQTYYCIAPMLLLSSIFLFLCLVKDQLVCMGYWLVLVLSCVDWRQVTVKNCFNLDGFFGLEKNWAALPL